MAMYTKEIKKILATLPPDFPQPREELTKFSDGSATFNDSDACFPNKLYPWLESDPKPNVNYYLPQFSHGFTPAQTPLLAICSNSFWLVF